MKKTLILGLGISGNAAAEFLLRRHHQVIGYDRNVVQSQEKSPGFFVCSDQEKIPWEEIEQVVVSPGIHPSHPLYRESLKRGLFIQSEVELGLPYLEGYLIGVTGTNGKTTVTLSIEHLLNHSGISTVALGNVGKSVCQYLNEEGKKNEKVFVIELSSFQLETMCSKVFDVGLILNITPDHLDRYGSMEEYAKAKLQLVSCLKKEGVLFLPERVKAKWSHLLKEETVKTFEEEGKRFLIDSSLADHERENALAAWLSCRLFPISEDQFFKGLKTFQKPNHRIQFVKEVNQVSYFDDSKGTNIDAVIQAVNTMKAKVILIAGGVDKGASYLAWKEPFLNKVKHIVVIGQAANKIEQELSPYFEIKHADGLSSAVKIASQLASIGDCVLLSPGCSSYDLFRDYVERGELFQQSIHSLDEGKP